MKQRLLKSMLLLCALVVGGASSAWGETVTLQYTTNSTTNMTGNNDAATVGLSATDWSVVATKGGASNFPGLNKAGQIRLYYHANGSNYITVSSLVGATINSITVTYGESNYVAKVKVGSTEIEDTNKANTTGQYAINSSSFIIENGYSANTQVYILSIVINYTLPANTCAAPTFSPAGGSFTSAQDVTISTTTGGATIYYTTDGSTPTTSSNVYSSAIPVSTTTTIKAIAVMANYDNSSVASATYTILNPKTILEARTQATGDIFTQGIVTSVNGKTAYIQDNTAGIAVYNSAANLAVVVGDEITVQGTLGEYNKLLQIQTPTIKVLSQNNEVNPIVKTIAEINADYAGSKALQGILVKIENATVSAKNSASNTTIRQGENSIVVRDIDANVEFEVNDRLTFLGNVSCYNSNAQLANPQSVVVTKNVAPVINANNVTIDFDETAGEIAYTIENPTEATLTAAITSGDWISNIGYAADRVTFSATANTGAQRTATITLYYEGAENKVVTITQNKNGAAALPFTFDGGKADIENTYGLIHNDLGSNYSSSPKLKFDGTGDYVILRINEVPGTLSFDIKGNGFSKGSTSTFKVQASVDGENYSDLATYTKLGDKKTVDFELATTVRFIKWVYTEKGETDGGNVALGNISLTKTPFVKISTALYATYVPTRDVSFPAALTAYVPTSVEGGFVHLEEILDAPAGTPVILKAAAGTYDLEFDYAGVSDEVIANNKLLASDRTVAVGDNYYALASKGTPAAVGFYLINKEEVPYIPAGKAYLVVASPVKEFYPFAEEDDETAIKNVNVNVNVNDSTMYDLSGRQVQKPTKGIYLVNGKKILF